MRRESPGYYFKKSCRVYNTIKLKRLRTIDAVCGAIVAEKSGMIRMRGFAWGTINTHYGII